MAAARARWLLVAVQALVASVAEAQPQPGASPAEDAVVLDQAQADASYERWHTMRPARPLRAVAWEVMNIGLGTAWYWAEKDLNELDWEYPSAWSRINGDAVRLDDNGFFTNTIGHPSAGIGYYGMARASGLDIASSLVAATLTSTVWEFGLEWREKVSINDLIFTPLGGMALGEVCYQLAAYLNSAPGGGGAAQQAVAATIGFPLWVNDRLSGVENPTDQPIDDLGLSTAFWHRIDLGYEGQSLYSEGYTDEIHGARLDVEIVSIPRFMRAGRFTTGFADGNFADASLRLGTGPDAKELVVRARAIMAGVYMQRVDRDPGGGLHGHGTTVGLATAFRHTDRRTRGGVDQVAVTHVLGPVMDLRVVNGPFAARFGVDVYGDFAAITSTAYPTWAARNGTEGVKSVLASQGYYYGLGLSARLRAGIEVGPLEMRGNVGYGAYESIDGIDREQETVTRDVPMTDRVIEYEAWLGFTVPHTPLHLRIGTAGDDRRGSMGSVIDRRTLHRVTLMAGLAL